MSLGGYARLWASNKKSDAFLVRVTSGGTLGSRLGAIYHDDILAAGYGGQVISSKGTVFFVLRPTLADFCTKIRRVTQVVYPKDIGAVLLSLNVGPGASVLECGSGSGGMTVVLAHMVGDEGTVVSYDLREEHQAVARENCHRWGVGDRVRFCLADLEMAPIAEQDMDACFVDVRCPWKVLPSVLPSIVPGGRVGILVPTVNQVESTLSCLREQGCADLSVIETFQRRWRTNPERLRPDDTMVGHTGFLVFASTLSEEVAPDEYW
ncbi:MAG: tRNA (adenine-N1)-methyltransferase [Dethiosulfovibrio peptidovorans]|nr:MAG: tRNA (adenine-N1)-methyltransferase [Dethiosulfovibrio peptidovorans]